MSEIKFLKKYFNSLKSLIDNEKYFEDLIKVKEILKKTHSNGKKNNDFWKWWKCRDSKPF